MCTHWNQSVLAWGHYISLESIQDIWASSLFFFWGAISGTAVLIVHKNSLRLREKLRRWCSELPFNSTQPVVSGSLPRFIWRALRSSYEPMSSQPTLSSLHKALKWAPKMNLFWIHWQMTNSLTKVPTQVPVLCLPWAWGPYTVRHWLIICQ